MQKPSIGFTFDLPSIDTTPIVPDAGPLPGLPDTKPAAAAGVYKLTMYSYYMVASFPGFHP